MGDTWVAPTFVILGLVGELAAPIESSPPGSAGSGIPGWARRTGRATIIGLPSVYYLQQITGGNRPSDGLGSDWEPFDGSHGVSGHTFLGAVERSHLRATGEDGGLAYSVTPVALPNGGGLTVTMSF